nr:hypothetical protein [Tanacetum cinerariifolium]
AYAGFDIPDGWLVCDGRALNSSKYPALYLALGYTWGTGAGRPGDFTLPDMRGMFLRGVDILGHNDPDNNKRVSSVTGLEVG